MAFACFCRFMSLSLLSLSSLAIVFVALLSFALAQSVLVGVATKPDVFGGVPAAGLALNGFIYM